METMYWFILLICSEAIVSFGDNTESVAEKQTESEKTHAMDKRIVMHSNTDLLHIISNLSSELQALRKEQASYVSKVQTLQNDVIKLQTGTSTTGSTYVRWGRNTCPNGTELVYSGYAAGSYYSENGAAANYICLSPDPVWGHYTDVEDSGARVYGVEFEFQDSQAALFFGNHLMNDDAPCSVCRAPRASVLMIPGRNICYDGWTLEYKGYLVADRHDLLATEYVCLDLHPDTIVGGHNDENGALFYFVEGRCGSLKCPPYVNGRELTCAVCSK